MRVLLVAENVSVRMGGEAAAPFHYFRLLPERGVHTWLVAHARVCGELKQAFPDRSEYMLFIDDNWFDKLMYRLSRVLPDKLAEQTIGAVTGLVTQYRLRRLARQVVHDAEIDLVHQVYPISPKAPSALYGLGVPVVIGAPLSGGMQYPPGFRNREGWVSRLVEWVGRLSANLVNRLIPGKLRAAALLVANPQTRAALPAGCRGRVYDDISEVAVDAEMFAKASASNVKTPAADGSVRFVYLGRLVDWKAVDLLIDAFHQATTQAGGDRLVLQILGDGKARDSLETQAQRLGLSERIEFVGWVSSAKAAERLRAADVFVLPSLRESGGIVVVEAMAAGLPVIVSDWGGPALTVDSSSGIRVAPTSPDAFVKGLANAMLALVKCPEQRTSMGAAAKARVRTGRLTWPEKIEQTVVIYRETLLSHSRVATG